MARMGRPIKEIDKEAFEKLCAIMCTQVDIAGFFDVSVDTIERFCQRTYKATFAEIYKSKSAFGKVSLRRKQYEVAMSGNVPLLIWLGKQHLGQTEKQTVEILDEAADEFESQSSEKILQFIKGART